MFVKGVWSNSQPAGILVFGALRVKLKCTVNRDLQYLKDDITLIKYTIS